MRHRLPAGPGGSAGKLTALLDAAAGVEYEGEAAPRPDVADRLALKVWNFLATGMGGIEWARLDLACAYYGVEDVEGLIARLLVIKAHKAPETVAD